MKTNLTTALGMLVILALLISGCSDTQPTAVTTDMQQDFDHDHKHQHGDGQKHEHTHDDQFQGTHSHGHEHSHRHGSPLHGGRVVSLGHTHHKDGETHYHVEVLPIKNDKITIYILVEEADGKLKDHPVKAKEIIAYLDDDDNSSRALETTFLADAKEESSSQFTAAIPEQLLDVKKYSIVAPKIKLGDERLSFSFTASRNDDSAEDPEKGKGATEETSE